MATVLAAASLFTKLKRTCQLLVSLLFSLPARSPTRTASAATKPACRRRPEAVLARGRNYRLTESEAQPHSGKLFDKTRP
jgi:hypothetical protein